MAFQARHPPSLRRSRPPSAASTLPPASPPLPHQAPPASTPPLPLPTRSLASHSQPRSSPWPDDTSRLSSLSSLNTLSTPFFQPGWSQHRPAQITPAPPETTSYPDAEDGSSENLDTNSDSTNLNTNLDSNLDSNLESNLDPNHDTNLDSNAHRDPTSTPSYKLQGGMSPHWDLAAALSPGAEGFTSVTAGVQGGVARASGTSAPWDEPAVATESHPATESHSIAQSHSGATATRMGPFRVEESNSQGSVDVRGGRHQHLATASSAAALSSGPVDDNSTYSYLDGTAPACTSPNGTAPIRTAPPSITPVGTAPNGTAPTRTGLHSTTFNGTALNGVVPNGTAPSGTATEIPSSNLTQGSLPIEDPSPSASSQPASSALDLSSLLSQPQHAINRMDPQQYTDLLTLVAHLTLPVPPGTLPALARALPSLSSSLNAPQLSQVLYAFSAKRFALSPAKLSAVFKRAQSLVSQGGFPANLCAGFLCSCVQQHDLGAGRGGRGDPKEVHIMLKIRARLLGLCCKMLTQQLDTLPPSDLARSMWALSRLGHCSSEMLDAAAANLHVNLGSYPVKEMCQVLNAFRLSRYHAHDLLTRIVAELAVQSPRLNIADINCCLQACAVFNTKPDPEHMSLLTGRLLALVDGLSLRDVCTTLWCLGVMQEVRQEVFGALWGRLQELSASQPLLGVDARQACQAHISARLQGVTLPTRPDMLEQIRTAWKQQVQQSEGGGSTSSYVSALLRRLGVRHEPRRPTRDGLSAIHVALQPAVNKFVALQLLSTADTARNSGQLLGPVLWQRELLQSNGWQVQFLKASDLKSISAPLQPLFLAELCTSFGCKVDMPSPDQTALWPEVQLWQAGQWRDTSAQRDRTSDASSTSRDREMDGTSRGYRNSAGRGVNGARGRGGVIRGSDVSEGGRDAPEKVRGGEQKDLSELMEREDFVEAVTRQLQAMQEPDLLSDLVEDDKRAREAKAAKQQQQRYRKMHG